MLRYEATLEREQELRMQLGAALQGQLRLQSLESAAHLTEVEQRHTAIVAALEQQQRSQQDKQEVESAVSKSYLSGLVSAAIHAVVVSP